MKRKIVILTIILFILLPNSAFAQPNISSPAAILIDGSSGQILYSKNIDQKNFPASITKIMTALLLIEDGNLDKVVKINKNVPDLIEPGSSQIYLIPGEELTREQLLNALLIDSANDAAVAIAQDVAGSVDKFSNRMNEKAKSLGAKNTHFVNPHGLHDENHYTSPRDMALIAKKAMKNPLFRKIVSTERYIIPTTNKQETRYLYTSNRLIRNTTYKNYYYEKAIGIKTGYTRDANFTLVGGAKEGERELISVVMNSNGVDVYKDTHKLFDFGFDGFMTKIALEKGKLVKQITTENIKDPLPLVAQNSFRYSIPKESIKDVETSFEIPKDIHLPINKGDVIGNVVYSFQGEKLGSVNLIANKSIESPNIVLTFLSNSLYGLKYLGMAIGLFLIYRTFVYIRKKKRRTKRIFRSKIRY